MSKKFYTQPALSLLALSISSSLYAAEPVSLGDESLTALQADFQMTAPGIDQATMSTSALHVIKQRTDVNQINHIRVQQKYHGFDVFGGYGILHSPKLVASLIADTKEDNTRMNGVVFKGLDSELGEPSPDFEKNKQQALNAHIKQFDSMALSEENVQPLVYIDEDNKAHWAYQVSVLINHDDNIPERPTAIIDAETYKPFVKWNDIKTLSEVNGIGFGGNDSTRKYEFGKDMPLLHIMRDDKSKTCFMENKAVKVIDMKHGYNASKPMRFQCQHSSNSDSLSYWTGYNADGYDLNNGAYSPANDALYIGEVITNMYHRWYGLNALTIENRPMQLEMRVHYGKGYENAFWDGKRMTFGDGKSLMHPLVSLTVGAHEISHGFTQQHSNLKYYGQSGGMNESFSDMAASAAEAYSLKKNSWKIGADIMKSDGGLEALRYMEKPSQDGRSIDRADQFTRGMDVHYSSGVYNRLFYLMANKAGWNTQKAFHVMIKANMDYWTPYSNFEEGGCGIISAAQDIGYSVADIKASLDDVGIRYKRCPVVSFKQ